MTYLFNRLVWDQMQCSSFKWINFEINTLVPYNDEIMFENSLMLSQNSEETYLLLLSRIVYIYILKILTST